MFKNFFFVFFIFVEAINMNINAIKNIPVTYYQPQLKQKNSVYFAAPRVAPGKVSELPNYNSSLSFHPSFGYYPKSSADALKEQENSSLFKFERSDINDEIPKGYKNIFYHKQASVVGAGSIFSNFLKFGEIIDFYYNPKMGNISIFDPKFLNDNGMKAAPDDYNVLKSLDDIRGGSVYIISPNKFHVPQMTQLSKNEDIKGIYTDKPVCISKKELAELEKTVQTSKTPLYFGDFFFFSQIPAIRLMGVKMPYKDAITVQFDNSKNKTFSSSIENAEPFYTSNEIKNIVCKTIEQGSENFEKRGWLKNKEAGGGVLLDLQVHISNLLNLTGLELTNIDSVSAKKFNGKEFSSLKDGEVEDRAVIEGKINRTIPVYMETAQYMPKRENYIWIEGKDGNKIKITTDVFDKKTELINENGNIIARAYTVPIPYSLMIHHSQNFFDDSATNKTPMFFDVQRKTMKQLFAVQDMAYRG